MRALCFDSDTSGKVVLRETPDPATSSGEVLIRVKAAGICGTDLSIIEGRYKGRRPVPDPIILGHEASGLIEEIGPGVRGLHTGDRVSFEPVLGCGICHHCKVGRKNMCEDWSHVGITRDGAFADYITVHASQIHKLPRDVSFLEGACLEPIGLTARSIEGLQPSMGDSAVIIGPGAIGLFHLQVLKRTGCSPVLVVGLAKDKEKLAIARSLGADCTIVADQDDPVTLVMEKTNGVGANLVVESAGSGTALGLAVNIAAVGGKVSCFGLYSETTVNFINITRRNLTIFGDVAQLSRHFVQGIKWVSQGQVLVEPLVARRYSLAEADEAFAVYRSGAAKVIFEI